jgi:hypothetical protein
MGLVKVPGFKCEVCGHIWTARYLSKEEILPTACAKCKSPYWNRKSRKQLVEKFEKRSRK